MMLRKIVAFSLSIYLGLGSFMPVVQAAPKKTSAPKKTASKKPVRKTATRIERKKVILHKTSPRKVVVSRYHGRVSPARAAMLHLPPQMVNPETFEATAQPGVRYTFGTPAGNEPASQSITVTLQDNAPPRHEPLTFKRGEVVQFVVTNQGTQTYEVAIGDTQTHKAHLSMLRSVPGLPRVDDATSIVVPPQQSKTLTWKFSRQHPRYPIELAVLHVNDVLSTPQKSRINLHP